MNKIGIYRFKILLSLVVVAVGASSGVYGQKKDLGKIGCLSKDFKESIKYCDIGNPYGCFFSSAIHDRDYVSMECLIRSEISPNIETKSESAFDTPLIRAAINADTRALNIMLRSKHIDLEVKDKNYEMTPLQWLCFLVENPKLERGSYFKTLKLLANSGANVNASDKDRLTPLMLSSKAPRFEKHVNTNVQFVRLLLEHGANSDAQANLGETALMLSFNDVEIIDLLIQSGANVNLRDNMGKTAIFYAIELGQIEKLDHLIKNGADLNLADNKGFTPLMIANRLQPSVTRQKIIDLLKKGQTTQQ